MYTVTAPSKQAEPHTNVAADYRSVERDRIALENATRFGDAIQLMLDYTASHPLDARGWADLGRVQGLQGHRVASAASLSRAVELDPDLVTARLRLGFADVSMARLSTAGQHFAHVLAAHPENVAARAGSAMVLQRLGHVEDAWTLLRSSAGRRDSAFLQALVEVAIELGRQAEVAREVTRLAERTKGVERSACFYHLGSLLDSMGEAQRAWRAWEEANRCRKMEFDVERHDEVIDEYIRQTRALPEPSDLEDERPVFIVGMPRSGTTLLESILDSHSSVAGVGELEEIRLLMTDAGGLRAHFDNLESNANELGRKYLAVLDRVAPGANRVVDKMPHNALFLGTIATVFPKAKVIFALRNPDDVAVSCFQQNFGRGHPWSASVEGIRGWQRGLDRLREHWKEVLDVSILEVRYEDVVEEPERTVREICRFVGVDFEPAMLEFHTRRRQVATASALQVTKALNRRSVGRGEKYARHLSAAGVTPRGTRVERAVERLGQEPARGDRWLALAWAFVGEGRLPDALQTMEQFCGVAPDDPKRWHARSRFHWMAGQHEAALECLDVAQSKDGNDPDVLSRSTLYRWLLGEAVPEPSGRVAQMPGGRVVRAGRCLEAQRAWDLLADLPMKGDATAGLPLLVRAATELERGDEAAKILRGHLRKMPSWEQPVLLRALGDLYASMGRHGAAWRAWEQSNRLRALSFDAALHARWVDALIKVTTDLPQGIGDPSDRPVFIVGMPRSGTTLLETVLDSHTAITGAGELSAINDIHLHMRQASGGGLPDQLAAWREHASELGQAYLEELDRVAPGAQRAVDKMPNNALHVGLIHTILPNARILWIDRNPDDVALSCFQKTFGTGLAWATSLDGIRAFQAGLEKLRDHWAAQPGIRMLQVRYEQLVQHPEEEVRRICAFLDVPYEPQMLAFHERRRQVATASFDQVTEKLNTRSIGRAEPYRKYLHPE